jgi:hypothetical protein
MLENLPIEGTGAQSQVIDSDVRRYDEGGVPMEITISRAAPFLYLRETVISHDSHKGIHHRP